MNLHPTTTGVSFYLQMMATCISSQGTVAWQETHLENTEMHKTSKKVYLAYNIFRKNV